MGVYTYVGLVPREYFSDIAGILSIRYNLYEFSGKLNTLSMNFSCYIYMENEIKKEIAEQIKAFIQGYLYAKEQIKG
jgi:hypothetical protein